MIRLPIDGALADYRLSGNSLPAAKPGSWNRIAFAAAHVVADPLRASEPGLAAIDWERTIAYRGHLISHGFGIAEAMDTAQRGMGLGWNEALELITRSLNAYPEARIYSGCGTDHLDPASVRSVSQVVDAYLDQMEAIQKAGGRIILMASRALARIARTQEDYIRVYSRVLADAQHPVILHWLGPMFDPALKGYWGADEVAPAMDVALAAIAENKAKVDGIKISLLDAGHEITMRRRLPEGVKMYTGDDFNYPELIAGDEQGYSHALLGIFDAIAPAASAALSALAEGNRAQYDALFAPTLPLSRLIFRAPTQYYKTGVVFLAWLNGHQDHFIMVGGQQAMRPISYFADIFRLADQAGLLADPDRAQSRMKQLLALHGM